MSTVPAPSAAEVNAARTLRALLLLDMLYEHGPLRVFAAVAGLEVIVGLSTPEALQLMLWWQDHEDEAARTARAALVGGRTARDSAFQFDPAAERWQVFYTRRAA